MRSLHPHLPRLPCQILELKLHRLIPYPLWALHFEFPPFLKDMDKFTFLVQKKNRFKETTKVKECRGIKVDEKNACDLSERMRDKPESVAPSSASRLTPFPNDPSLCDRASSFKDERSSKSLLPASECSCLALWYSSSPAIATHFEEPKGSFFNQHTLTSTF